MLQEAGLPAPGFASAVGVGWQCVIDMHGCESAHLDDLNWVRRTMLEAAALAEATVVEERFHRFLPHGISGVVVIGESHLAIHIWPERKFAAFDVFTCNTALKMRAAADHLISAFQARHPRGVCVARGGETIEIGDFESTNDPLDGGACEFQGGPEISPTLRIERKADSGRESDDLYIDHDSPNGGHWFICNRTIASCQTAFQKAEIVEFVQFGRALVLDGGVQSVESDEYIYHEALVHPALCLHPHPRKVLIVGGGEGAVAREVLKHPCVERVVMVDIDGELIALAREHLENWHRGSFDDPRLDLVVGDGFAFVRNTREQFDAILVDLVDSAEDGPAERLYTPEFYASAKSRLTSGGILTIQGMECHIGEWKDHARVRENLEGLFVHTCSYATFMPSFWCNWGFVIASDSIDPSAVPANAIDRTIAARGLTEQFQFYDGTTHNGLFALGKNFRKFLGAA